MVAINLHLNSIYDAGVIAIARAVKHRTTSQITVDLRFNSNSAATVLACRSILS